MFGDGRDIVGETVDGGVGVGDIGDVREAGDVVDYEGEGADMGDLGEEMDGGKVGGVEEEEEVVEEMDLVEEEQEEEEGQYTLESLPEEILFKILGYLNGNIFVIF